MLQHCSPSIGTRWICALPHAMFFQKPSAAAHWMHVQVKVRALHQERMLCRFVWPVVHIMLKIHLEDTRKAVVDKASHLLIRCNGNDYATLGHCANTECWAQVVSGISLVTKSCLEGCSSQHQCKQDFGSETRRQTSQKMYEMDFIVCLTQI